MAYVYLHDDGALVVNCNYDEREVPKALGGKWNEKLKSWIVGSSKDNLDYLQQNLLGLVLEPNVQGQIDRQVKLETTMLKLRELAKTDAVVPLRIDGLNSGITLRNYQKLGVLFATSSDSGVLIGDDCGLGKTGMSISSAILLKSQGKINNCLVITPASLKWNWALEIPKFCGEKFVVIDGNSEKRMAQWLKKDVFFTVVNYELLVEDLFGGRKINIKESDDDDTKQKKFNRKIKSSLKNQVLSDVRDKIWGCIISDELHAIKSHKSLKSNALKKLKSKYRIGLTGTPLDGKLEELHSIMEFVKPGLFTSKTKFLERYATTDYFGKITGYKHVSEVRTKIAPYFLRRLKEDVLKELPSKIYQTRYVILSDEERKIYKKLAEQGHKATEDSSAMTTIIRCKQFLDHPLLIGENLKHHSKLDELREILEDIIQTKNHKVLIFTQYRTMIDILVKLFDEMRLKFLRIDGNTPSKARADMQAEFNNDPSIDLMVGTSAMSTGLNLTGADYVVFFDKWWSNSLNEQASSRCHRIGQKNVVNIITLLAHDTIEERIESVLKTKSIITSEALGDGDMLDSGTSMNAREIAKLL